MNFFRRLRAAWRFLDYLPYVEAADHEDLWGVEDSRSYTHFMKSATGQKLRARCTNLILQSAVRATQAGPDPVHRNGWASGVAATFAWLDLHLIDEKAEEKQKVDEADRKLRNLFTR